MVFDERGHESECTLVVEVDKPDLSLVAFPERGVKLDQLLEEVRIDELEHEDEGPSQMVEAPEHKLRHAYPSLGHERLHGTVKIELVLADIA